MGVVPGLFNINEPILFGAPIIMNPLFFLPFVLVPMVNATLAVCAGSRFSQPRGLNDAVDYTSSYRRVMGRQLEFQSGHFVSDVHGDIRCDVPSVPESLRKQLLEQENENAVEHAQDAAQSA